MLVKGYVHAVWDKYRADGEGFRYAVFSHDMSSSGYVLLEAVDILIAEPVEEVLRRRQHDALMLERSRVLAEASVKADQLEQAAKELLALPEKL